MDKPDGEVLSSETVGVRGCHIMVPRAYLSWWLMVGLAKTTFDVPSLVEGKGLSGMNLVWLLATEKALGSWKPFPRRVAQW